MCYIKFLNLSQRRKESRKVHIIFLTDIAMPVTISGNIIFASQFHTEKSIEGLDDLTFVQHTFLL